MPRRRTPRKRTRMVGKEKTEEARKRTRTTGAAKEEQKKVEPIR